MDELFKAARTAMVFRPESGKRYDFGRFRISVMTVWPKPAAWEKTRNNPFWRYFRPDISYSFRSRDKRLFPSGETRVVQEFPSPPRSGSDAILSICSPEEMVGEGRIMRNCVGSHVDRVAGTERVVLLRGAPSGPVHAFHRAKREPLNTFRVEACVQPAGVRSDIPGRTRMDRIEKRARVPSPVA